MNSPQVRELWTIDYGSKRPGEPANIRPCLVIAPLNSLEWGYRNALTIPLTTTNRNRPSEIRITPTAHNGLSETSWSQCELMRSMPFHTFRVRLGIIEHFIWEEIREVVRHYLDFRRSA